MSVIMSRIIEIQERIRDANTIEELNELYMESHDQCKELQFQLVALQEQKRLWSQCVGESLLRLDVLTRIPASNQLSLEDRMKLVNCLYRAVCLRQTIPYKEMLQMVVPLFTKMDTWRKQWNFVSCELVSRTQIHCEWTHGLHEVMTFIDPN